MTKIEQRNFEVAGTLRKNYRKSPQIRSAPKIELKKKYSGLGADLSCKNHAKNPRIWTGIKPEIVHFR